MFSLHVFRAGIDGINVAKARCMPLFYGHAFQGFSTADKMSTIFKNVLKTLSPTVFLATTAKGRTEIMC